eukprot:TRINITY_DN13398_c0_g2_i2.p1 TRINITY_DN13398_c0_g2~~TRINITY_DN13398_c0_g2_i2.p1  ORF type:complete len:110 (+),score=11.94 TRINITY_DN13398_c0_g2_i2:41-331(+)
MSKAKSSIRKPRGICCGPDDAYAMHANSPSHIPDGMAREAGEKKRKCFSCFGFHFKATDSDRSEERNYMLAVYIDLTCGVTFIIAYTLTCILLYAI